MDKRIQHLLHSEFNRTDHILERDNYQCQACESREKKKNLYTAPRERQSEVTVCKRCAIGALYIELQENEEEHRETINEMFGGEDNVNTSSVDQDKDQSIEGTMKSWEEIITERPFFSSSITGMLLWPFIQLFKLYYYMVLPFWIVLREFAKGYKEGSSTNSEDKASSSTSDDDEFVPIDVK